MYRLHSLWKFSESFALKTTSSLASIKMRELALTIDFKDEYQDHTHS